MNKKYINQIKRDVTDYLKECLFNLGKNEGSNEALHSITYDLLFGLLPKIVTGPQELAELDKYIKQYRKIMEKHAPEMSSHSMAIATGYR